MTMKYYRYLYTLLIGLIFTTSGCKDADVINEHHFHNKLYVTSAPVTDDLLIQPAVPETSREISYRINKPAIKDVKIMFDAAPYLTASYNLIYGDNASLLESDYYDMPVKNVIIKAGDTYGDNIIINFKNTDKLDDSRRYVLPITIINATELGILENKRTVYYIFKGAALINVVANIRKIQFPIKWKSNVSSVPVITVEALLRSKDWVAGRDNALSSIFGIENKFLVRVGDSDRPRDQVQIVAPGGNFPGPNRVPGLAVDEWIHIAVVYDSTTGERLFYKDGVLVYGDKAASSALSLTTNCYIGRSWDATRWLPGEISELRIWGIQRTAEEIANNPYQINPTNPGLIAYWKFNEGTGIEIKDHSGNGNDIIAVPEEASAELTWVNVEIPAIK